MITSLQGDTAIRNLSKTHQKDIENQFAPKLPQNKKTSSKSTEIEINILHYPASLTSVVMPPNKKQSSKIWFSSL